MFWEIRELARAILAKQHELQHGQRQILVALTETSRFTIGITRNEDKMDFQIFDDGKGVTFTATPDKPLQAGEVPTWAITQGDNTALVLAPAADGLSCVGTLSSPAVHPPSCRSLSPRQPVKHRSIA